MAKKAKKVKPEKIDGLSPGDIKKIRIAVRRVWSWSYMRKLCKLRSVHRDGFHRCEQCKGKVPEIYIDHKIAVGDVDEGFIARLFCPSSELQALCNECHNKKTRLERAYNSARKKTQALKEKLGAGGF